MVEGHADSARVLTMISPLEADSPPTKASSARVSLCAGEAEAEGEVFGVGANAQLKAGPEDQRHGQTHQ